MEGTSRTGRGPERERQQGAMFIMIPAGISESCQKGMTGLTIHAVWLANRQRLNGCDFFRCWPVKGVGLMHIIAKQDACALSIGRDGIKKALEFARLELM